MPSNAETLIVYMTVLEFEAVTKAMEAQIRALMPGEERRALQRYWKRLQDYKARNIDQWGK